MSMNGSASGGRRFDVGQYFVLYFDLMGVKGELFKNLPPHEGEVTEEKQKEIDTVSRTILNFLSDIQSLHRLVKDTPDRLYDSFMRDAGPARTQASKDDFVRQAAKLRVGVLQGSDTTMLYVRDSGELTWIVLSMWLLKLPLFILTAMREGVFVRGCLLRGTAWEIKDNCLFGPVIREADEIERNLADYARIVATKEFVSKCVETCTAIERTKPGATRCNHSLLSFGRDEGDLFYFDYLGERAVNCIGEIFLREKRDLHELANLIRGVRGEIIARLERFKDERVHQKYEKLLTYFDAKVHLSDNPDLSQK